MSWSLWQSIIGAAAVELMVTVLAPLEGQDGDL
jgi:hypothetical protein